MRRYLYRPLLPAANSIRLIQINAGGECTDIHCDVIDYTIQPHQAVGLFGALSYVWGDSADSRRIHLSDRNGRNSPAGCQGYLEVTRNLYAALHHLRD